MKSKLDPLTFLLGLAIGVVLALIIFLKVDAAEPEIVSPERCVQMFQETVTLVPLTVEPIFIRGLGEGEPEPVKTEPTPIATVYIREGRLTKSNGRVKGPTNEETYYNLDMDRVIVSMRNRGYAEEDYPYYIREDGVKMLGDYVMVAADLDIHPKGSIVETSLGQGMVCDTGDFTDDIYDIAVNW